MSDATEQQQQKKYINKKTIDEVRLVVTRLRSECVCVRCDARRAARQVVKKALPADCQLSREAELLLHDCVLEFVGFVTSEASEQVAKSGRKTVSARDYLQALATLGMHEYADVCRIHLATYEQVRARRGVRRAWRCSVGRAVARRA